MNYNGKISYRMIKPAEGNFNIMPDGIITWK